VSKRAGMPRGRWGLKSVQVAIGQGNEQKAEEVAGGNWATEIHVWILKISR